MEQKHTRVARSETHNHVALHAFSNHALGPSSVPGTVMGTEENKESCLATRFKSKHSFFKDRSFDPLQNLNPQG